MSKLREKIARLFMGRGYCYHNWSMTSKTYCKGIINGIHVFVDEKTCLECGLIRDEEVMKVRFATNGGWTHVQD
jgi:hypothetical protein